MRSIALALLAVMVAACSAETELPTTTTKTVPESSSTTTQADPDIPAALTNIPLATISVDGRELLVAIADTAEVRSQGLKGVSDLGDLDGMLFVWDADTASAFHMLDTLIPLDIAFFSVGGGLVDRLIMEPCTGDPCPLYSADRKSVV